MNILLSNDDGVFSEGLRALVEALHPHHNITVAAPDQQRSGAGHSCTFVDPVRVRRVTLPDFPEVPAYAISGTPADCVRMGVGEICPEVDLVVSGINHGANLGTHVLYSGTVGAAMEAAFAGKPAIATSCCSWKPCQFQTSAQATLWTIDYLRQHPLPPYMILNLNTPDIPTEEIKGIKLAGLHMHRYDDKHVHFEDPLGNSFYWMSFHERPPANLDSQKDYRWIQEGYCTLTPIQCDIACYSYMEEMDVADFFLPGMAPDARK